MYTHPEKASRLPNRRGSHRALAPGGEHHGARRQATRCNALRVSLALSVCLASSFGTCAALLAQPMRPQPDIHAFDGQPIVEIHYAGTFLAPDTLRHYLFGLDTGESPPLDLDALDRHIHTLWQRELIDDIRVSVVPVTGGVRLEITIVDRPRLLSVHYVGLKRVANSDIKERIDRDRVAVYEGQPVARGELERLTRLIEEMYREKGFRFAQVNFSLEEVSRGQVRATYTIDEGDKVKIGDINFDGNTVYSDFHLRRSMKKTKESGFITKFFKKDIYNPANIDEDLDNLRELYRKKGYKDILIARPEITVEAKRPKASTIEKQKRRLAVTIPIEEGERWKLGDISIDGNEVLSDEFLLRQFEHPKGGWLRAKTIDDALEKITDVYRSLGYIFSDLETELRERPGNIADLVLHIDEKDQFRVGRIQFDGNEKTRDKVLRRELLVQESTVMNMSALRNSMLKIRQLNYFDIDENEPIDFDFNTEEKTVDLTLKGTEADRTELQFGGGWSEFDGFFGQFSMRTRNFLGRGETLGVSAQIGRQRDIFDLEYAVPWFLDRPQSLGIRLFSQSIQTPLLNGVEFIQDNVGGSLTYGRNLRPFQTFSITYSFSDLQQTQTFFGNLTGLPTDPRVFDFSSSSIRPQWLFNRLDNRLEPFRGMRALVSMELAGTFLGGDTEFVRPTLQGTWFKPVSRRRPFKSTFGLNVELSYIRALSNTTLFPLQRFFLGGENSVRGFRRRSLTVIDDSGRLVTDSQGFPIGGDFLAQFNVEYHVIPGGPFRVVFFADAGGVFNVGNDIEGFVRLDDNSLFPAGDLGFSPGRMRYSAGIELRVLVPLFGAPLRFIYAKNLDPLAIDQFQGFDFNIGTSF